MSGFLAYRSDVDGLRTVAVLSVVVYHALPDVLPGGFVGVDVFFVISGYLIGSILMNEFDRNGRIDFADFWARRMRRLAPSAILVIAASLAVAAMVLPAPELFRTASDAVYAALYLTNWQSLFEAVSYFDESGGASLFLHFWSLAVEEQFYIYFSGIFLIGMLLRGRVKKPSSVIVFLLIGFGLLSLILNLTVTYRSQPEAFFGTHTRIWQLTAGVVIGLAERSGKLVPADLRPALAWPGILMISSAVFFFDGDLRYPGWFAFWPTIGAALVIYSGIVDPNSVKPTHLNVWRAPLSLLASRSAVYIGKCSYALYLWHWPIFVLWREFFNSWNGIDIAAALLLSFAVSLATHIFVENPIRYSALLRNKPLTSLIGSATLISLCIAGSIFVGQLAEASQSIRVADGKVFDPEIVRRTQPIIYEDGCHLSQSATEQPDCVYGVAEATEAIVLFGDSHAAHWFPAFHEIALNDKFALYNRTKSACAPIDIAVYNSNWKREYTECAIWRERTIREIERIRPAFVIIGMSSQHKPLIHGTDERLNGEPAYRALAEAEIRTVNFFSQIGTKVFLMRDTPWLSEDPLDCLADSNRNGYDECQWPAEQVLKKQSFPWGVHDEINAQVVDIGDSICPNGTCKAFQDGMITMRDRHHITPNFAQSLSKVIASHLNNLLVQ